MTIGSSLPGSGTHRSGSHPSSTHAFNGTPPQRPVVAYFCMEYALSPSLPIYAGGLGALAGDHFNAAADLGIPFYAIGIRWREGYVRQEITPQGHQKDRFSPWTPPPELVPTGVQTSIQIQDQPLSLEIWRLRRGSATLLLLDVAHGEQHPLAAQLTRRLYEGSSELRVAQEMVLGIGGVRALATLGIHPDVYHFNEGHAVLGGIELIRQAMREGLPFEEAWRQVRRRIVFTTHTPVEAGNEVHDLDLLARMGACNGLTRREMTALGGWPFSMTVAGLRLSRRANAVSRMHGITARQMWAEVSDAAPITSITNGVHRPTWQHPRIARAYENREPLNPVHQDLKRELLNQVRKVTGHTIDSHRLVIGSARRAAPYKRGTLLFHRPEVIEPLLESGRLAVLYAGKAHPDDQEGKAVVARMVELARRYPDAVAFLPDYDLQWATYLVQGSDVWLNQPTPPMEASGTSGMKAAMNGVLNLSVLDGWWAEACHDGVNGWQFGGGYIGPDQDDHDADSLYEVLQDRVLPTFQSHQRWEAMMRQAIDTTVWAFDARRMVIEYWNLLYRDPETPVSAPRRDPALASQRG